MPEEALMDAPADIGGESLGDTGGDFGGPDLGDTSSEVDSGSEPSIEAESTEGESEAQAAAPAGKPEPFILDGKRLSEPVRKALEPLRTENPRLFKQLVHSLFTTDRFGRELPGGFNEIAELRTTINDLGGPEGIQKVQGELAQWDEFDQKFTKGDPAFIDELADTSPEAFLQLVQPAIAKYAKMHPEGFNQYISGIVARNLEGSGAMRMMERLGDFIEDNPKALEIWNSLSAYLNGWKEIAGKEVQPPTAKAPPQEIQTERAQLEKERTQVRADGWKAGADSLWKGLRDTELTRLMAGKQLSGDDRADLDERFMLRLKRAMADPEVVKVTRNFWAANDREGYMRHIKAIYQREIPKVLSSLMGKYPLTKGAPKPAPANGQPKPAATAGKPDNGFVWIGKVPTSTEINWNATSAQLYRTGKAVRTDGKRVQWKSGL